MNGPMPSVDALGPWIREMVFREDAIIETALERALPGCGPVLRRLRRGGWLVSAEPDPSVPYGYLHEHQVW